MLGSILTVPAHNTGPGLGVSTEVLRGREGPQGDLLSPWELEWVVGWVG